MVLYFISVLGCYVHLLILFWNLVTQLRFIQTVRPLSYHLLLWNNSTKYNNSVLLTLWAPASLFKFSSLVSIHFIKYKLGELVKTSRLIIFGDHFPNSQDLYVFILHWYDEKKFDADHWLLGLEQERKGNII